MRLIWVVAVGSVVAIPAVVFATGPSPATRTEDAAERWRLAGALGVGMVNDGLGGRIEARRGNWAGLLGIGWKTAAYGRGAVLGAKWFTDSRGAGLVVSGQGAFHRSLGARSAWIASFATTVGYRWKSPGRGFSSFLEVGLGPSVSVGSFWYEVFDAWGAEDPHQWIRYEAVGPCWIHPRADITEAMTICPDVQLSFGAEF